MARKKKSEPKGAPDWMVTFGDMMSLLLCFFVIIVSMSEIKENERFQKVKESIKKAFGYKTSIGLIPGDFTPTNTMSPEQINLILRKYELKMGRSSEKGIEGEYPSVKRIREGMEYTIGGKISFESGKAILLEPAKKQLDKMVGEIIGINSKIRVRGHAARKPPSQYRPFSSLDDLSYARGLAIKSYLMSKDIREERITVEAIGDNEPIVSQAYDENDSALNRRVSIIITENLIEEYQGNTTLDNGGLLDG